jgi:hypothetical protein
MRLLASIASTAILITAVPAVAATAADPTNCPIPRFGPGAQYHPSIDRSSFTDRVTNPWLPMRVGTTLVYAGSENGRRSVDVLAASRRTRLVDGVRTRVVHDDLLLDGILAERTRDYYAQDRCGNVWYFGEDTAELDRHGHVVSREGSWHAGVNGAQPGVVMQADPQLGRRFRQEWLAGHAADVFVALTRQAAVSTPYGSWRHALRTRETSALEPGIVDAKFYVRGIGEVREKAIAGPREGMSLVAVLR